MYWVRAPTVQSTDNAPSTMSAVDYELLHRCMGHPSKDVLRAGLKHIKDFPDVYIPSNEPVCPGCQLGKQPNHPFTHNEMHVTNPFELVYLDLKSFPVELYHKFKYAIILYDDYTSMGWVLGMHSKDQALLAVKAFLKYVQVQYQLEVKGWMSDQGGTYKSKAFEQLMHDNGIHVYDSAPHTPQQNGCAE